MAKVPCSSIHLLQTRKTAKSGNSGVIRPNVSASMHIQGPAWHLVEESSLHDLSKVQDKGFVDRAKKTATVATATSISTNPVHLEWRHTSGVSKATQSSLEGFPKRCGKHSCKSDSHIFQHKVIPKNTDWAWKALFPVHQIMRSDAQHLVTLQSWTGIEYCFS